MGNVLLVTPTGIPSERLYSISEAGQLYAVLSEAGYNVSLVDCNLYPFDYVKKINQYIEDEKPCLILLILQWEINCFGHWIRNMLFQLVKGEAKVGCAGRGATMCFKDLLNNYSIIDFVIRGESENVLIKMTKEEGKSIEEWSKIDGIAYRWDDELILTKKNGSITDLDGLPFSWRDYLSNKRLYPIAPINTSRYCYGECTYCVNRVFRRNNNCSSSSCKSAKRVVDEIEYIRTKHRTKYFYFLDDNFFIDGEKGYQRAQDIVTLIKSRNLKIAFFIECRSNDVHKELFVSLKEIGLKKVFLGIESGSQRLLDRYNKNIRIHDNIKAIRILRDLRIDFEPGFIMFDPEMEVKDLKLNVRFVQNYELYNCKFSAESTLFNDLILYKGSEIENSTPRNILKDKNGLSTISTYKFQNDQVQLIYDCFNSFKKLLANKQIELQQVKSYTLNGASEANMTFESESNSAKKLLARCGKGVDEFQACVLSDIVALIEDQKSTNEIDSYLNLQTEKFIKSLWV